MNTADIRESRDAALLALQVCDEFPRFLALLQEHVPFHDSPSDTTPVVTWEYARAELAKGFRNLASAATCVESLDDQLQAETIEFIEVARVTAGIESGSQRQAHQHP